MKNYDRQITLMCPICGNDQFSALDNYIENEDLQDVPDETRVQCSDCKSIFLKSELLKENQRIIDANFNDVKKEATKDFEKELNKKLKKILK